MKHIFLFLLMLGGAMSVNAQNLDRSVRPEPGPAREVQIGDYETFTLDNGLRVFVVENHKLPTINVSLRLDIREALEGDKAGLSSMAGAMMGTATDSRSKDQIDEEIDFIGARINFSNTGFSAASLSRHKSKLFELASDLLLNAKFTSDELEKNRKQTLSGLATELDNPDAIMGNVRSVLMFGKDHYYGEVATEETVENIELEDVQNYYETYFRPNVGYLAIVGDVSLAEIKPLVEKHFGSWEKADVPRANYPSPKLPEEPHVAVVNKAGAVQTVISVANPVALRPGDPDEIPAKIMNAVLGGSATARLFGNLREAHGWTYGAYSSLDVDIVDGSFSAGAKVRNEVTDSAMTELLYELNRIRDEDVPEEEIEMMKSYMSGVFAISLEDPSTVARLAVNTERYHLPKDYYRNYLRNIEKVTASDVHMVARKYVRPDRAYIIAVGNAEDISEKLEQFSPSGEVHRYDNYGNIVEPPSRPIPEGMTGWDVIEGHIKALGGREKLATVKDMSSEYTGTAQGMEIVLKTERLAPNLQKVLVTIPAMGMTAQSIIFDGKNAKISGMQGDQPVDEDRLQEFKEGSMFPALTMKEKGYKVELAGVEKVNDKDAYVVKVTDPDGKVSTEYYDMDEGLRLRTVSTEEAPGMGEMTQTLDILGYEEVDGVKVMSKFRQAAGPQIITFVLKEAKINSGLKKKNFKIPK